MKRKIIITAGLPYSNGDLHIGHVAGAHLPADINTRYLRLQGHEVRFICGSDDHGVAIVMSGLKENKTPAEIVATYHKRQKEAFDGMGINFDVYGSTSGNPQHKHLAEEFFLQIEKKNYFTKEESLQFFDEVAGRFLPDRYVKGTCGYCQTKEQYGDQCENCGKMLDAEHLLNPLSTLNNSPVGMKTTTHWFLDLSMAEDAVKNWVQTATLRDTTRAYVEGLISGGLIKRSMTRDLDWGIPVPLDTPLAKGKVMYVWFDAPVGYISFTAAKDQSWWKKDSETEIYHYIGEDNTIFHCVVWIAMLSIHGGYKLPTGVIANSFMNIKSGDNIEKISKSRKNALWIRDYIGEGNDPDFLRYYLTMIAPEKARTFFDESEFISLSNSDLADTLGNFINRSTAFSEKYLGDTIPAFDQSLMGAMEKELNEAMERCYQEVTQELDNHSTRNALKLIFDFARLCNKYFNDKAPWSSRKTNIEDTKMTLNLSYQCIYFLGMMLRPFLPTKTKLILSIFFQDDLAPWSAALQPLKANAKVQKLEVLFTKMESK